MRSKLITVALITILLYVIVSNSIACGPPTTQYDLTINSTEGGDVTTPEEAAHTYDAGEEVDLVATADGGYQFVNWTGDVGTIADINDATTTITMNGDYTITANFAAGAVTYDLTINSTTGGDVTTPGEGTHNYTAGMVVSLVATPDAGYHFVDWTGNVGTIANVNAASTTITMNDDYSITANFEYTPMAAAGWDHTVGLKSDGTVVAAGRNDHGQCNVGGWTNIIQVAAGYSHTVGLKADGTVVAVGDNTYGQCDVGGWTGIIQVAARYSHTVGLKSDGTVVAVGWNDHGQCNVGGWTDITQVVAGDYHTVGIKSKGTAVAVGGNDSGQCNVRGWTGITQVVAGSLHTVGLKSDGTVIAVGGNDRGQCNVGGWTNIIQVAAGGAHTVGLKTDGMAVALGYNTYGQCDVGGWTGIIEVAAGAGYTVGLKSGGTVVAVGGNDQGQCNVTGWDLT